MVLDRPQLNVQALLTTPGRRYLVEGGNESWFGGKSEAWEEGRERYLWLAYKMIKNFLNKNIFKKTCIFSKLLYFVIPTEISSFCNNVKNTINFRKIYSFWLLMVAFSVINNIMRLLSSSNPPASAS